MMKSDLHCITIDRHTCSHTLDTHAFMLHATLRTRGERLVLELKGHLWYNRQSWISGPYLHRLQCNIQTPSRMDFNTHSVADSVLSVSNPFSPFYYLWCYQACIIFSLYLQFNTYHGNFREREREKPRTIFHTQTYMGLLARETTILPSMSSLSYFKYYMDAIRIN